MKILFVILICLVISIFIFYIGFAFGAKDIEKIIKDSNESDRESMGAS